MDTITFKAFLENLGDAKAAELFGVTERTVGSWRRGERFPRSRDLPRLIERSGGRLSMQSFFLSDHAA